LSKRAVRTDSVFQNVGSKIRTPGNHPKERIQQAVRTLLRFFLTGVNVDWLSDETGLQSHSNFGSM